MGDIKEFVKSYGYIALLIGYPAEGETLTILGGVAVHRKILFLRLVFLIAVLGAFVGD